MNATCTFFYNPVLVSMIIEDENLIIQFKKYTKRYYNVPRSISFGLLYSNQKCVQYFNTNIKNKYKNGISKIFRHEA